MQVLCASSLCSNSLTNYTWWLPARVKLWTLLKHFFYVITCISLKITTDIFIVFVQLSVNLILETFELLLTLWALFSCSILTLFLESSHLQLVFHLRFLQCDRSTVDKRVFSNPTVLFAELYSFSSSLKICQLYMA